FCDTLRAPRLAAWPSGTARSGQGRAGAKPAFASMASAPNPGPSTAATQSGIASVGTFRLLAVAAPHLVALVLMSKTEADFGSRLGFVLSWGILNCFWIALLRRPALSGALSLALLVLLVLLSRLKHDVLQMTANFVDVMVIDRDTTSFLFTIFPN